MKIKTLTFNGRKTLLVLGAVVVPALGLGAYFAFKRPPRVAMTRYAPASSLAFAEVYSLGDVVDGLTSTKTWRELAPVLGLSSQLREIGPLVNIFGRTGLGPDEAVIAGRAQFGLAVTGLEAETGSTDEGPYVHFKPHFALIVETHSSPAVAERLVRDKVGILARRIFGDAADDETGNYQGVEFHVFHGADSSRQLLTAATSSLILIGNDQSALKSCLDCVAGRAPNLADDPVLARFRPVVDRDALIFGYMTSAGIGKLSAIGPAIISSRFTTDPDRMNAIGSLFQHISDQALTGLLYGAQFTAEGVTDRYLTVTSPYIASAMTEAFKPSGGVDRDCLKLVPRTAEDFTVVNVEELGGLPERALKRISPGLDVVGGLALREFVLGFFGQLGDSSRELIKKGLGDQMVLVKFNRSEIATIAEVRDRPSLAAYIQGYLGFRGAPISTENYKGVEISMSAGEDGRAAAFKGRYILMGTRARICQMVDAGNGDMPYDQGHPRTETGCYGSVSSVGDDTRILQALNMGSPRAPVISCGPCPEEAGSLMLMLSKLTRTTDGSPEILERDDARRALDRLPPSVSFTEFREIGVYTETRSAVGNLSLIASLGSGD